jgi:hypothetical protein
MVQAQIALNIFCNVSFKCVKLLIRRTRLRNIGPFKKCQLQQSQNFHFDMLLQEAKAYRGHMYIHRCQMNFSDPKMSTTAEQTKSKRKSWRNLKPVFLWNPENDHDATYSRAPARDISKSCSLIQTYISTAEAPFALVPFVHWPSVRFKAKLYITRLTDLN